MEGFEDYLELPGVMAATGRLSPVDRHSHHALEIVVARRGVFEFSANGVSERLNFAVARNREPHGFDPLDAECVALFVEPDSELGRLLGDNAENCRFFGETMEALRRGETSGALDRDSAVAALEGILERFSLCDAGLGSPYTEKAKAFIDRELSADIRVDAIARAAGVSLGRLQHVFRRDMGISMKRYRLWRRLVTAFGTLHEGGDLSDAAFAGGFSDSAHLSRTCKAMVGLTPSGYAPIRKGDRVTDGKR